MKLRRAVALTLTVFYLHGYTLNRITLFALIFSIGILVVIGVVAVGVILYAIGINNDLVKLKNDKSWMPSMAIHLEGMPGSVVSSRIFFQAAAAFPSSRSATSLSAACCSGSNKICARYFVCPIFHLHSYYTPTQV